ncbi:MAG: hypothetical protein LBI45_04680 [Bacteroidales bacterium]|jgi:hypothetical protein|nr:hypothetical protein [Bacteroidales bacterium]
MNEKIEKFICDLKQLNIQLPELRDYFWLNIDRSNETDMQRGILFDKKFEKIKSNFKITEKYVIKFLENSFNDPKVEARKEAINKLSLEFQSFNEWDEVAKNALIEKYTNDILIKTTKSKIADKIADKDNASRKKQTKLLVTFPDGTQISENEASETLAETINKIGIDKVKNLYMIIDNVAFISKNKEPMHRFIALEGDYFANVNSSSLKKKRQLEFISKKLNLGLIIEIVKK